MKNFNNVQVVNSRSLGNSFDPHTGATVKSKSKGSTKFERNIAEKQFLRRVYTGSRAVRECHISSFRANFLIVFSPDGTKLASTNGNHNVYIIDVATNKVLKTLKGHERTPWTVAFHPTNNNILASGCLSGEVRVWNLSDDSFESWQSPGQTVIASVAFHPKYNLLAIATYKDIYFWGWNTSIIFGQTSTENVEEKIRYIKFDSSGDKLITAIALKNKMLSQYDSIAFREVFQFSCERRLLKDIKLIEKFCEDYVHELEHTKPDEKDECVPETPQETSPFRRKLSRSYSGFSLVGETMPYMCIYHWDLVAAFLNVGCFCPAEFSTKVLNMLKKNVLPFEYLVDRCYFCRYTWLYNAVFQLRLMNLQRNHICKEFCHVPKDYHIWSFSDCRSQELLEENTNQLNGITEETLRYCFEQFAKSKIAPYFSDLIPDSGLCSKNTKINSPDDKQKSETSTPPESKKPFTHEIPMRSDCFLNFCETFNFRPSATFLPFLTSFAELYHYLPALQQISTKDDRIHLNMIMTEWEYLYCKLLLINNIIEGDEGLILKKRSVKKANENVDLNLKSDDNLNMNIFRERQDAVKRVLKNEDIHLNENSDDEEQSVKKIKTEVHFINFGASTSTSSMNEVNCDNEALLKCKNCEQTNECDSCGKFDKNSEKFFNSALQLLRKDIDILTSEILRRNDSKTQRHRIEKLFKQQLETEISRIDGALFITIQIIKKCIRMHLSTFTTELKKLLKVNLTSVESKDPSFDNVYPRLLFFVIKRAVTFTRNILEFLCEYKYNITELTESISDSVKTISSPNPPPTIRLRTHQNLNFRRNCNFDTDEPVFKEESVLYSSELSDDESNVEVPENILSAVPNDQFQCYVAQRSRPGPSNQSADFHTSRIFKDSRNVVTKKVIAARSYINKHLKFLECASDRRLRDDSNVNSHEIILLQNVNLLLHQLQYQSEQNPDYHSSHPLHRLQVWDFSDLQIPDISKRHQNIVVSECKVHNDATISISHDDTKVAVLLSPNQYDQPDWLGVFSLEWKTLGQILCSVALNQIAVSLSFSPTDHYLAVGFSFIYWEDLKMADIISVDQEIKSWRDFTISKRSPIATSLIDITFIHRTEFIITVNCIRWSPIPGQGLIFGNSFGEIKFVV